MPRWRTFSRLLLTLLVPASLGVAPALPASAGGERIGPGTPVGSGPLPGSTPAARRYWTAERMREARSLMPLVSPDEMAGPASERPAGAPGMVPPTPPRPSTASRTTGEPHTGEGPYPYTRSEIVDPSVAPYRTHGKVFLTMGGGDYVCSGTALSSANASVVWTAGHCLFDLDHGGWATNWAFVPGRRDGQSTLGTWPATRLWSTIGWTRSRNLRYDMGAAVIDTDPDGRRIVDVVGGRGFGWNQPQEQTYAAFGYPAAPPFDGERLWMCTSGLAAADAGVPGHGPTPIGIGCDMTGGSSGGGWVTSEGLVVSNISYGIVGMPEVLFGPYFDGDARLLYEVAEGTATPPPAPPPPSGRAFRPDGAIKLRGEGAFLGDDVYNTTGRKQTRAVSVTPGTKVYFVLRLENDGNQHDAFTLDPCAAPSTFALSDGPDRETKLTPVSMGPGKVRLLTFWVKVLKGAPPGAQLDCRLAIRSLGSDALDVPVASVRSTG